MRVLIFTVYPIPHLGGLSSNILFHQKLFKEANHKVDVLSLNLLPRLLRYFVVSGPAFLVDKILKGAGFLWNYSMCKLIFGTWLLLRYQRKKWDIILAHDICAFDSLWGIRLKRNFGAKTYLVIHDYYAATLVGHKVLNSNTFAENFALFREKNVYRIAPEIITVDSRLGQYVQKFGISSSKISVITNVIDTNVFRHLENQFLYRELFGLPKDKFIILIPRRLVPKNGVEYAVLAAEKIKRSRALDSNFLFAIAGSGTEEKRLRTLVRRLGVSDVVFFLGPISHERMPLLYAASDCVIIPSINFYGVEEATSLAALEAMSCSLPVIASELGGLKEIIVDSVTGKLVPPRDVEALTESILRFLNDKEFRLFISSRAREFSVEYARKVKCSWLSLISN